MANKEAAQQAIFENITRVAGDLDSQFGTTQSGLMNQTVSLRNLALAYRYASGGPQPGGSPDSK